MAGTFNQLVKAVALAADADNDDGDGDGQAGRHRGNNGVGGTSSTGSSAGGQFQGQAAAAAAAAEEEAAGDTVEEDGEVCQLGVLSTSNKRPRCCETLQSYACAAGSDLPRSAKGGGQAQTWLASARGDISSVGFPAVPVSAFQL